QLINLSKTNKRFREVCSETLEQKKEDYFTNMYPFKNHAFPKVLEKLYEGSKVNSDFYRCESDNSDNFYGVDLEDVYFKGNFNHAVLSMLKYIYDNSNVNFIDILLTDIESAFDEEISFDLLYQNLLEELSVNDYTNFYLKKV